MLLTLNVQNFAIIDNVTIDFKEGFTALTGETGAGKSLIIDAINLLLGERATTSMIRTGEARATIEGVFECHNAKISGLLEEYGIENDEDLLIIKREILISGKSLSRINGCIVTLSQLEAIAHHLADVHTQLDTKRLFDNASYLAFLENEKSLGVLAKYQSALQNYQIELEKYQKIIKRKKEATENAEFWRYRYHELQQANLRIDEENELNEQIRAYSNYEQIFQNLNDIKNNLEANNIISNLYDSVQSAKKLAGFQTKYQELSSKLESIYYDLSDLEDGVNNEFRHLDFDEAGLDAHNERLSQIQDLKRRYRMSVPEIIAYQGELENNLSLVDNGDFDIKEQSEKVKACYMIVYGLAQELHTIRSANADKLEKAIVQTLRELELNNVQMQIAINVAKSEDPFKNNIFRNNGIDDVDIMISFNRGEELRPLAKVASGGEMSRVMLALKVHFYHNYQLSTMIFDEIDSGVSGKVAYAMASKLKEMSQDTQVLAITHLPIVAAAADQHLFISKETKDNRTITKVTELAEETRVAEIAKMISSETDFTKSQVLALEMINSFK